MNCCNRKNKRQTMICKTICIENKTSSNTNPTTRPNLQKRYHVNKLWLWDEPDVRKFSMSMDIVGTLCILQLAHQWLFVTQSECIYNCITVWTVSMWLLFITKWAHYEQYHCVNKYNTNTCFVLTENHVDCIVPDNNSKSPQLHSDISWHI
jgi:hypothetical protein